MNYLEISKSARMNQDVSFSSEMEIFTHHFPKNPILPGALSALLLAETCAGPEWSLKKISGLRFRKPLTPDLPVKISCDVVSETPTDKHCTGKILSGADIIADGEFIFDRNTLPHVRGAQLEPTAKFWNGAQVRDYLPHGEPIVLIDNFVKADYPEEIQAFIAGNTDTQVDQTKLVGTKVHTRSVLKQGNFWVNQNVLPSAVLSELVAQAGALTLAPFFTGTKPQVSLLGCDTEYFALAEAGSTIDTFVELTRAKRLGKMANMIIFKSECYVGNTRIANISLNAMASF